MGRSGLGSKVVGLAAAALVLFACAAGTAQAEKGATWMVNGKNIETGSEEETGLAPLLQSVAENNDVLLLFTLFGIAGKVLCKTMQLINFKLWKEGMLSRGKIRFTECVTLIKETVASACLPSTGGVPHLIESSAITASLMLVGGVGMVSFQPAEGEFFTVFKTSEECILGEDIKIEGGLILKDCQNQIKVEQVTHLLEADVSSTLKIGSKPATLEGSINVTLGGEHIGLKWSGLPA